MGSAPNSSLRGLNLTSEFVYRSHVLHHYWKPKCENTFPRRQFPIVRDDFNSDNCALRRLQSGDNLPQTWNVVGISLAWAVFGAAAGVQSDQQIRSMFTRY